jgi:hypothetical protein
MTMAPGFSAGPSDWDEWGILLMIGYVGQYTEIKGNGPGRERERWDILYL